MACGHFQFSANAQGADSVLAGNGPFQKEGRPGIPTVIPTLRTDSPRLCTSHPQVCEQASPGLPRPAERLPAPLPGTRTAARTIHAHYGSLLPPPRKEGPAGVAQLLQDDDPATTDIAVDWQGPGARRHTRSPLMERRPAAVTRLRKAADAGPTAQHCRCSPGPGACRRARPTDRGVRVGPRLAGAITRRAAKEVKPWPEGFASTPECPLCWMPRAERLVER